MQPAYRKREFLWAHIASEAKILKPESVASQIVWVLFLLMCVLPLLGRSTVASMDKGKEYRFGFTIRIPMSESILSTGTAMLMCRGRLIA